MDIAYILANKIRSTQELRYSLRTVERHFPCDRVFFVGGCPDGFKPDVSIQVNQEGENMWERVSRTIHTACKSRELSEDFWLFNDDFFILRDVEEPFRYHRGDIRDHAATISGPSDYRDLVLTEVADRLEQEGLTTIDYTLHIPMRINKEKALAAMWDFSELVGFRNLYGNYAEVGGEYMDDIKIATIDVMPEEGQIFASTTDEAFGGGVFGAWLWQNYTEPSRWEE